MTGTNWKCEEERRAMIWLRFDPNAPCVSFYYRSTQGETYAGSLSSCRIQPLEHRKDPLMVFRINTDAIVTHSKYPTSMLLPNSDPDMGRRSWIPIFKCICE